MILKTLCEATIAIGFLSFSFLANAQTPQGSTFESYNRASQIVDAAIEAMGGLDRLKAIESIDIKMRGKRHMLFQSLSPDGPLDIEPTSGRIIIDYKAGRLLSENLTTYPGEEVFSYRWVIKGNDGFVIDLKKNNQGNEIVKVPPNGLVSTRATAYRNVPSSLLLQVRELATTLRWLGEKQDGKEKQEIVTFVQPDRTFLTLYFDTTTHLLRKYETLQADGGVIGDVWGDTVSTTIFPLYQKVGDIQVPAKRIEQLNGVTIREVDYDVSLNTEAPGDLFDLPAGYVTPKPSIDPNDNAVRQLADGVFLDKNTNAMFVIFKDYVMAIEAPASSAASQATINAIHATAPGKPIKYLAFTHYHFDHAGGLRGYIAEGATIVTTPGNKGFVERLAAVKRTISPDVLSLNPKSPVIETFDRKRVFTDGEHTVELYNIGPTPHVNELTIAYLPKERILFQADLFFAPATGEVGPALRVTNWFAQKIKEMGLRFDTIIDPDGRLATIDEFRDSLKKGGYTF